MAHHSLHHYCRNGLSACYYTSITTPDAVALIPYPCTLPTGNRSNGTGNARAQAKRRGSDQLDYCDVHVPVSRRRRGGAVFLHLEGILRSGLSLVGVGLAGHWHELSPAAYPPRLQNVQVGGVLAYALRHACARRRADL